MFKRLLFGDLESLTLALGTLVCRNQRTGLELVGTAQVVGRRAALLSEGYLVLVLGHLILLGDDVEVWFWLRILFEFLRRLLGLLPQDAVRPGELLVFFLGQGKTERDNEVVT